MDFSRHPLFTWLQELRRDFHRHPETAFQEVETTAKIKAVLSSLGLEIQELEGLDSGAVALLAGPSEGKTIGLRADIDALPIQEMNEVSYRSRNEGKMHACGHDGHTAIMLGVAKNLVDSGMAGKMRGTVKFIFQPAEENVRGARAMIEAGVLSYPSMDRILAFHMWPEGEAGTVGLYRGYSHAATDSFRLEITGRGSHGARPHQGIDPVVAAAHFITVLQTIVSRNIDPADTAVVSVGKIIGGTATNIIPDKVQLEGTVRTFSERARDQIICRFKEIIAGVEAGFGVETEFEFIEGVIACRNDEAVSEALFEIAAGVVGKDNVSFIERSTGGEDFALFTREIPGALIRLGCRNTARGIVHPLHSSRFDIDETILPIGVEIISKAVMDFLS